MKQAPPARDFISSQAKLAEPARARHITRMQRTLIILGIAILVIGLLWPFIAKLGLGRLPGDIVVRRENFAFYFPIVTCLIVSVAASFLFWLFRR